MDFAYEKKLKRRGYKIIAGVDEVGVGPLAGPVTACAFVFNGYRCRSVLGKVRDSKLLNASQREYIYDELQDMERDGKVDFAVASLSPGSIDRFNIRGAVVRAMRRAVKKLSPKTDCAIIDKFSYRGDIIPATFSILVPSADRYVASVAAASIIAKVTRDRAMVRYHKKYPQYRFDLHKGYGTELHKDMLAKHGPCPIHRKSFRPVSSLV